MADLRIPGAGVPAVVQSSQSSTAVRAAQRAFFDAALKGAAPAQATRPTAAPIATQPVARTTASAAPTQSASATATSPAEPVRYARPGSILDIKV